ncbi:KdsC family phosphatase [Kushneria phosphatilytica]|uniref:3-deoxy-D-manno-octulosonate 8-phosphate phosphatase KdsC n=1 Tax=Kushneria phosphatilytica TaxID=657387 RepID=A0A1S1NXF8_9GAMM|nr:HAD hydrolase family protein [Kushneria phosphatilytica]OHV12250.1 HAD family hydrolase [Kushneria phosphatilytica]QEL11452.1 HAD hydrolase family protein [Kushneria phosphatilytica]
MSRTEYNPSPEVLERAARVRLLALDVDGVMTDGGLNYTGDPHEHKRFHVRDGLGLKLLQRSNIEIAIITGRNSSAVTTRAEELGIEHVYQGCEDKWQALSELLTRLRLEADQAAYCGDDLVDLAAIRQAGLGVTVNDAPGEIRQHADYVTLTPGGHGAVREICELILKARGEWDAIVAEFASC